MKTIVVFFDNKIGKTAKIYHSRPRTKAPKKSLQPHSEGLKNMTAREHILASEGGFKSIVAVRLSPLHFLLI